MVLLKHAMTKQVTFCTSFTPGGLQMGLLKRAMSKQVTFCTSFTQAG